jgi:hypothetical protein
MSPTRLLTGLASVVLLVLGLVALLPDCASACSCVPPLPGQSEQERAERELTQSSTVFAGEVVSITKGEPGGRWRPATLAVSLRVSEVWKGPERETLEVNTPSFGPACGYRFSEGEEYLVYAMGKKMKVDSCGETTLLSNASAHLAALGNGETLGGSGVLTDTSGGFPPLGVVGGFGGAVAVVSLAVLMRVVRTG